MFPVTKSSNEGMYIKVMRALLAASFLAVPLLFFTNLTSNPFTVQGVLLYVLLAGMYAASVIRFLRAGHINFTRTFFDLAFMVFILACAVSWLSAVSAAPQYMRQTLLFNLLDYGTLLLVVALGVALAGKGLVTVAACACATVFLVERLLPLLPF